MGRGGEAGGEVGAQAARERVEERGRGEGEARPAGEQVREGALADLARGAEEQAHVGAVGDDLERRPHRAREGEGAGHDPVGDGAVDAADGAEPRQGARPEGARGEDAPRRLAKAGDGARPGEERAAAGAVDPEGAVPLGGRERRAARSDDVDLVAARREGERGRAHEVAGGVVRRARERTWSGRRCARDPPATPSGMSWQTRARTMAPDHADPQGRARRGRKKRN